MSECSLSSRTRRSTERTSNPEPLAESDTVTMKRSAIAKKVVAPKKPTSRQQPTKRGRGEAGAWKGKRKNSP